MAVNTMRCRAAIAVGMVVAAFAAAGCAPAEPAGYDIGRDATPEEIAAWDIDVDPAGNGLPPGAGTAVQGKALFAALCAGCHGANGQVSSAAAQLVQPESVTTPIRRNVRTHWPYAPPLFDYIRRAMPSDRATSYGADTIYAIVAFLLEANRIEVPGGSASATSLPKVRMPSRSLFVPDDRQGGRSLR
jgi:mono/diheme cytochrome c family protein